MSAGVIDWVAVRARLARAAEATEQALNPSPERARRIMDERARVLAPAPPAARPAGEQIELLVFSLAGARYGIETRFVREVARLAEVTPIPGATDFLAGVAAIRGEILGVLDPRPIFGLAAGALTARMILCGEQHAEFGLLIDQAHDVVILPLTELFEPPGSASGAGRAYLRGVTKDALVVLDGARLLGDEQLFVDRPPEAAISR